MYFLALTQFHLRTHRHSAAKSAASLFHLARHASTQLFPLSLRVQPATFIFPSLACSLSSSFYIGLTNLSMGIIRL